MEKQEREPPRRVSTIAWIMSRPEGKQFLTACLVALSVLSGIIVRQEFRFENNVNKMQTRETEFQGQINDCKQETIDILKQANETTSKMRDSLYILGMKAREIETRINRRK